MLGWLTFVLRFAAVILKSRRDLLLENLALRHQLLVLTRNAKPPRWTASDRALWARLAHTWSRWRSVLRLVQPDTVIGWHRQRFRLFWKWQSRPRKAGRKATAPDTNTLIRDMSRANPL
jgi:putative transposase